MKKIFFPGNIRQACAVQYGIFFEESESFVRNVHVVIVQKQSGESPTSLINSQEGRDVILNHILNDDLKGIRVEFVIFSLIFIADSSRHGFRFPILLDIDDYINRGNEHDVLSTPPSDLKSTLLSFIGKCGNQIRTLSLNARGGQIQQIAMEVKKTLAVKDRRRVWCYLSKRCVIDWTH